jgi:hypothetical protein
MDLNQVIHTHTVSFDSINNRLKNIEKDADAI